MVGGLNSLLTTGQKLLEVHDAAARDKLVIEFTGQIIAAQQRESAFIAEIDDLKKKIVEFENWEREKQRYQLEELPPGILVYSLKAGMENGEPSHKICANCYNKGQKSLLHNLGTNHGLTHWRCHSCGFDESTGHFVEPKVHRGRSGDWMG